MEEMGFFHSMLIGLTSYAILFFEYIGVTVIIITGIKGILYYIQRKENTRIILAKGMAMGLEFKLGSEILRTVIVREASEIFIVGSIIALRAILTFLIHWEIKTEERHKDNEIKMEKGE